MACKTLVPVPLSPPPGRRSRAGLALTALALAGGCASTSALPPTPSASPSERWAFTAPWDPRSAASVLARGGDFDALVLGWIRLDTLTGTPSLAYPDTLAARIPSRVGRMALVTTYAGHEFHPSLVRSLATDEGALARASSDLAQLARRSGYRGLVLDFEGLTAADSTATRRVVASISRAAHAAGVSPVAVAVPATDTAAYAARFLEGADLLLVMLYDEHWSTSAPGPIASPDWVRRALAIRVAEGGASRLVAALPLYGYLWRPNVPGAAITFTDATRLAAEAGVALTRDPATSTLHATHTGNDPWELWVSDPELVSILEREAAAQGVRTVAYWRLGGESEARP